MQYWSWKYIKNHQPCIRKGWERKGGAYSRKYDMHMTIR